MLVRDSPVDDRHEPTGPGIFEVEMVWRPLYIEGGERQVSWSFRKIVTWHVVGYRVDAYAYEPESRYRALCNNDTYRRRRRPMTWREMREITKWGHSPYRTHQICKSCQRIMNARARANGVR